MNGATAAKTLKFAPVSVPNLWAFLRGEWTLQRTIHDARTASAGPLIVEGRVSFADTLDGSFTFTEKGTLRQNGAAMPVEQGYVFRRVNDYTASVHFRDGRHFHDLDLRTGECSVVHACEKDTYEGYYGARTLDCLSVRWRVTGPEKNYVSETVLTRME